MVLVKHNISLIKELLIALIPYTNQNLKLVFTPSKFFYDLETFSGYQKDKLQKAYYRAKREKLIMIENGVHILSLKSRQIVQPFIAEKLSNNAKLMIIFDIPEDNAGKRQRFRNLLKQFDFKQIQLSVWMSDKDYRQILFESIAELEIETWVQLYEASKIVK